MKLVVTAMAHYTNQGAQAPPRNLLEHDTNSSDCWCCPDLAQPCPECMGCGVLGENPHDSVEPCWRCEGRGMIEMYDETAQFMIVHRDINDDLSAPKERVWRGQ